MCDCKDVEIGSYKTAVAIDIPDHMIDYKNARIANSLSDKISVDSCLVREIKYLWRLGVRTYGSCCGHNKQEGSIIVDKKDVEKMLNMGYKFSLNYGDASNAGLTFIPNSELSYKY